ncbi:cytoplasmic dynein 2 intermediate chain 1 isoform X1 [Osmerus eperlanus]|uniref:cytoplasmic dynein 2 intermediate chain 1 isoform X1 n=1 Tax=Osmerus eperlanus TaxID=29151 RepID=UPI002E1476A7
MHQEKKITREDTWKTDDLRKHIRGGGREEDHGRRREEYERQHRGGESLERRPRDPEREARRERDKQREKESTQEKKNREKDRHLDRRKERSNDRIGDSEEKERRREKDKVVGSSKYQDGGRESRDKIHNRGEKENRDREKERAREREKDKDRIKDRERDKQRDREKGAEERDRERRREERERRRADGQSIERKDMDGRQESDRRDGHKEREHLKESEYHDKRKDRERRERHSERERTVQKDDKESREHRRKEKEERERRHRETAPPDVAESRRRDSDAREAARRDHKPSEDRRRADGKGAERDRRRERRRREEVDPKREVTERSRDKRSHQDPREKREDVETKEVLGQSESMWRSSQKELSDTEEPVEKQDPQTESQPDHDGDAQDYEEDFVDYEEDFEEGSESGGEEEEKQTHSQEEEREEREEREELNPQRREQIEAIQRAMKEENERVGSVQTRLSTEEEEEERPSKTGGSETLPQQGKFIDFVAAKHREVNKKVACQQKKRSAELLRLIDLDYSITFSLLDLPPVNEYDMYIKSFGTTNTKQAYVQCNEDNTDRGIQTEELENSEKWTQHPAEWNAVCGGPNLSQEDSQSTSKMNVDSQRLATFLRSASQVVAVLLEEDRAERQSLKKLRSQADTLQSFSDGCLQLNTKLPFLHGRPISLVHFSQVQTQTVLSVHSPTQKPSAVRLDSKTIICIWNIWEPSRPQKILVYESELRSCCFSPGKATLVFAGTSVGSVVLWDLREHAGDHHTLRIGDIDWTLRHPTFSTDAVLAASGHMSSVSSVEVVPAAVSQGGGPELPLLGSDEESSGLSFQLASLDENGVLNLWVVLELPKTNEAGSQTDLGLRPGGKVKLLHSSTLLTSERKSTRDAIRTSPPQALLVKFLPSDPSHFFIGTNMGLVNHGTSHGLKAPPKFYRPKMVGARPVDVTSIDFSPFEETFFLVGCGDGSVRLHTVASEQPVLEWTSSTAGDPVVSVQWAQTRPAVFCVLDATSNLHIWDLLETDCEPVITEKTDADRVTAMAAFGDPSKQNTFSGIALARQSGKIEMQYFSKRFTVPDSADLGKLQSLKEEAFLD